MPTQEKVTLVGEVAEKLRNAQSIVVTDFKGISVHDMTTLRAQARSQSVEIHVIKNRLLKIALREAGCDALDAVLVGNSAVAFGMTEPATPAKILLDAAKKNDKIVIKGGLLEKKALDAAGVDALSKMPGRKELLARMAGDLKQPATKMVRVFNASLLKIAYGMNALAEKKQSAA